MPRNSARQRAKIIEAIAAIDADAIGLMEMENKGSTAIQNLVDGLNAKAGPGTYAAVPIPASGTGTDAIKVAMIQKPARLARIGAARSDTNPVHNRPPLAQTFAAANGEVFTLVVNHFKSRGCSGATGADLDQGDGQGCFNATRVQQADALRAFVAGLQASSGVPNAHPNRPSLRREGKVVVVDHHDVRRIDVRHAFGPRVRQGEHSLVGAGLRQAAMTPR